MAVDMILWQHGIFLCKNSVQGLEPSLGILSAGRIQAKGWLSSLNMVLGSILCAMCELNIHTKKAYVIYLSTSVTTPSSHHCVPATLAFFLFINHTKHTDSSKPLDLLVLWWAVLSSIHPI